MSMERNTRVRLGEMSAGVLCEKIQKLDTTKLYSPNFIYVAWGVSGLLLSGLAILLLVGNSHLVGFKVIVVILLMLATILFLVLLMCSHRAAVIASKKRAQQYIYALETDGSGLLCSLSKYVDMNTLTEDRATRKVLKWANDADVQELMAHPAEYTHTLRAMQRNIEMRQ